MYIFGYLRASTSEQDANRAKTSLIEFLEAKGHRAAGWYIENASGASLKRPELMRLLDDAEEGDAILVEQIDRLSRLDDNSWHHLKEMLAKKKLKVISLDLPTSHMALVPTASDDFTAAVLKAINGMMMDMLAAVARKDYESRRNQQKQGIATAKAKGKYKGRKADDALHQRIYKLRTEYNMSISETADMVGVSHRTVTRVTKKLRQELAFS